MAIVFGKTRVAVVCGGRYYGELWLKLPNGSVVKNPNAVAQRRRLVAVLDKARLTLLVEAIVQGAATGADYWAWTWAQMRGVPVGSFPADWDSHGKAAGPIRNKAMLVEAQPFCVIAFEDMAGPGTADMIAQAESAGVPVYRIPAQKEGER